MVNDSTEFYSSDGNVIDNSSNYTLYDDSEKVDDGLIVVRNEDTGNYKIVDFSLKELKINLR